MNVEKKADNGDNQNLGGWGGGTFLILISCLDVFLIS